MSEPYNHKAIEKKWQEYWKEHETFKTDVWDFSKPKYYALDMFPYPSGVGLHAGHPEGYTATDIMSRMKRMQGYNALWIPGTDHAAISTEVKVTNQLKEEGYVIEAVQNKGYHITQYPDILTSSEIMSQLTCVDTGNTTGIIREVVYYDETDSTNNEAKRAAERDNAADGTLYITESQTGGRGRRGRNWVSPAGSGIWMSLLLRPDIAPVNASMLTIVAAMAVQEAIHKVLTEDGHDAECSIKWPNDIVLNKKKVCGILTEMSAEMDYIHYVVIGMGINVNTTEFDDSIKATASSLYLETGDHLKRSRIVAAFSESFAKYYDTFVKTQNLAGLKEDYNSMLVNKGGDVKAIYADKEIVGKALGINDEGELIIKTDEGEKIIRTGEVSVRGLYGYV